MPQDRTTLVLLALFCAVSAFVSIEAIVRGRTNDRRHPVLRAEQPLEFWAHVGWGLSIVPLSLAALATAAEPVQAVTMTFLALPVAWFLGRGLAMGVTGPANGRMSRSEDPVEYWSLTFGNLLALGLVAAVAWLAWTGA